MKCPLRSFALAWVALMGVLGILSTPAPAQTLQAVPQTVTIAPAQVNGKAIITWDAGEANPDAEVWFKIGNSDEERFSGEAKGTQAAGGAGNADNAAPNDNAPDARAPDASAPVSFTGTWPAISGGTHKYTVILQQVDEEVMGSFSPGNGKIFDGVVVGSKLIFKWAQDGGLEGTGEFTLNEDNKGFKGSSTALKPEQFTSTWNTFVLEPAEFGGTWESISDGKYALTLTLTQAGDKVLGSYTPNNGKIQPKTTEELLVLDDGKTIKGSFDGLTAFASHQGASK